MPKVASKWLKMAIFLFFEIQKILIFKNFDFGVPDGNFELYQIVGKVLNYFS